MADTEALKQTIAQAAVEVAKAMVSAIDREGRRQKLLSRMVHQR